MSVVLMGWELGSGLGHVTKLLAVARGLAARGHTPVLALKDLTTARELLNDLPFLVLQAPHSWQTGPLGFRASCFSDVLAVNGYDSVEALEPLVNAWQALIDLTKPKLVIADSAPTLCLAAYGQLPTVMIGPGFSIPPASGREFPKLAIGIGSVPTGDQVLGVVQEVQRRRGRRLPQSLPAMFADAKRFVRTIDELDPYGNSRSDEVIGLLDPPEKRLDAPRGRSFYAYLSASHPGIATVLVDLAEAGFTGSAYVRGASTRLIQTVRQVGIEMHEHAPSFHDVFTKASVIIHHAGMNTAAAALAAGRPQVALPLHLEHTLTAKALERLGVGRSIPGPYDSSAISSALSNLMEPGPHHDQVNSAARRIESRQLTGILPTILDCCDSLAS